MEQNYTKVNLDEWNRGKLFKNYIDNMQDCYEFNRRY